MEHKYSAFENSEDRLWAMIEARSQPGADTESIDRRIWDLFGERWAIVFTDLAGFSRHAARFGIVHFLQVIHEKKKLLLPIVAEHDGFLVKVEADSFLLLFRRVETALRCVEAMQRCCQHVSEGRPEETQLVLCAGIGFGDILRVGDHECFGSEVNAASKLGEDTAGPHEILVTDSARTGLGDQPGSFEDLQKEVPGSSSTFRYHYSRTSTT